jgi:uncharacterized membrane protein
LRWKTGVASAVVVVSNVVGNFCLGWGVKHAPLDSAWSFLAVLLNPWVMVGVALLILWALSRMALLSWADLSYVLPVTAIGYPLTALMGRLFLNEQISAARWMGTLLIFAGFALVGFSGPKTTS